MDLINLYNKGDKDQAIYVCSPCKAETQSGIRRNMESAREYCYIASCVTSTKTIAPHAWLPELLDDHVPEQRSMAMEIGIRLLRKCKALFVCGDRLSAGMIEEIKLAAELDIPVFVFNKALHEGVQSLAKNKEITTYPFSGSSASSGIGRLSVRTEEVTECKRKTKPEMELGF